VKATLQRRNNDLHNLESRLQDQEAAACESPCLPYLLSHLSGGYGLRGLAACTHGPAFKMLPDFLAGQTMVILPGSCFRWNIFGRHMLLLSCLLPALAGLHPCAL